MPVTNVDWETRIIPARAGQTPPNSPFRRFHPDHPRACGANGMVAVANRQIRGSSPRVRGKLHGKLELESRRRIIPARAGQTANFRATLWSNADHPRACGANRRIYGRVPVAFGSSPRVRGTPGVERIHVDLPRIIPARAGQTRLPARQPRHRPDHPRACGANTIAVRVDVSDAGSSPRVRGKRENGELIDIETRIIPARAGQTALDQRISTNTTDHPRACGANDCSGIVL